MVELVVLDTNVLVWALYRDEEYRLVKAASEGELQMVMSPAVKSEARRIVLDRRGLTAEAADRMGDVRQAMQKRYWV